MSNMLRKSLIPAELMVASSLLLAPSFTLTGYGQNNPQTSQPQASQPASTPPQASQPATPPSDTPAAGDQKMPGVKQGSVDDVNVNPVRKQRRGIGKVVLVAQQQLKGMIARWQGHFGFGLTCAKMQMIEVAWDRLVQWRKFGIDQQVMMTGILLVGSCRRYPHSLQTKMHGEFRRDGLPVLDIDKIHGSSCGRRRGTARGF